MINKHLHFKIFVTSFFAIALAISAVLPAKTLHATSNDVDDGTRLAIDRPMDDRSEGPRRIQVMIELEMQPVAQIYAEQVVNAAGVDQTVAATQMQLALVEEAQLAVLSTLDLLDAEVIFRVQRVYNGIAVSIAPDQINAVLSTPGVSAVHTLTPKVPDHTRSVPFINAPTIWSDKGGETLTGDGITIAIIDTGIDYLHADFNGSRDYGNNNPEIIGDVSGFPGPKVIAGYDFAGDSYNADSSGWGYNPVPQPDPDPMDCYGHGTHVAGTVAGTGISPEQTLVGYDGPFDETTFSQPFTIGPGVAPAAKLIALKVFGCSGSTNLTTRAIEWAVDPDQDGDFSDHVDVINMSLGSTYGSLTDPTAIASDNAALIGVVVVAAAGNEGDVYYATGSPGASERAISVAAVSDHLGTGAFGIAASFTSRGPRLGDAGLKPDISAPGEAIVSARSGSPGTGSRLASGTSMAAPHVAGAMALLRQIHPDWRVEELKALAMNTARLQSTDPTQSDGQGYPYGPTRTGSGTIDLANALNTNVIAFNGDAQGAVGISFGIPEVIDSMTGVKNLRILNRGDTPARYLLTIHTIVDTAGVSFSFDRDNVTVPAGSSASVPVFLTAAAADLSHTRAPNVSDTQSRPRHWLSEESGHVLLWPEDGLFRSNLTGKNSSGLLANSDADFHYDPLTMQLDYTIRLADFTPEEIKTIQLVRGLSSGDGEQIRDIAIPADWIDSTVPLTGTVTLDKLDEPFLVSDALHLHITTVKTDAQSLSSQLVATPAVLHVPIYAAPKPASDMRAAESLLVFSDTEDALQTVHLQGHDMVADNPPAGYSSLVSGFELQYSGSGRLADSENRFADLHHVGITDNLGVVPSGRVDDAKIYFGIATYGDWSTPNQVAFDIYIDADEDGNAEYRLFNADARSYYGGYQFSDAFVAVVEDLNTGLYSKLQLLNERSSHEVDTNPFNTNILVLPVDAADIGLSDANPDFSYQIHGVNALSGAFVAITPMLHYDLTRKVIDLFKLNPKAPILDDHDGAVINLQLNPDNISATGESPNLLLLHHHNRSGTRAEIIEIRYEWPFSTYLPAISTQ